MMEHSSDRGWGRGLWVPVVVAMVLASATLGGCVTWHAGELRDVPWPPQVERAGELDKLALEIRFDTSMAHTYETGSVTYLLDVAIPTIEQSGLFELATRAEADYQLSVKVFPHCGLLQVQLRRLVTDWWSSLRHGEPEEDHCVPSPHRVAWASRTCSWTRVPPGPWSTTVRVQFRSWTRIPPHRSLRISPATPPAQET